MWSEPSWSTEDEPTPSPDPIVEWLEGLVTFGGDPWAIDPGHQRRVGWAVDDLAAALGHHLGARLRPELIDGCWQLEAPMRGRSVSILISPTGPFGLAFAGRGGRTVDLAQPEAAELGGPVLAAMLAMAGIILVPMTLLDEEVWVDERGEAVRVGDAMFPTASTRTSPGASTD